MAANVTTNAKGYKVLNGYRKGFVLMDDLADRVLTSAKTGQQWPYRPVVVRLVTIVALNVRCKFTKDLMVTFVNPNHLHVDTSAGVNVLNNPATDTSGNSGNSDTSGNAGSVTLSAPVRLYFPLDREYDAKVMAYGMSALREEFASVPYADMLDSLYLAVTGRMRMNTSGAVLPRNDGGGS